MACGLEFEGGTISGLRVKERENDMPGSLIDFAELLTRVENDRELMRDLLSIFK